MDESSALWQIQSTKSVALRESHTDKKREHRAALIRLQQRHLAVQSKLDRAYHDRLERWFWKSCGCVEGVRLAGPELRALD